MLCVQSDRDVKTRIVSDTKKDKDMREKERERIREKKRWIKEMQIVTFWSLKKPRSRCGVERSGGGHCDAECQLTIFT